MVLQMLLSVKIIEFFFFGLKYPDAHEKKIKKIKITTVIRMMLNFKENNAKIETTIVFRESSFFLFLILNKVTCIEGNKQYKIFKVFCECVVVSNRFTEMFKCNLENLFDPYVICIIICVQYRLFLFWVCWYRCGCINYLLYNVTPTAYTHIYIVNYATYGSLFVYYVFWLEYMVYIVIGTLGRTMGGKIYHFTNDAFLIEIVEHQRLFVFHN